MSAVSRGTEKWNATCVVLLLDFGALSEGLVAFLGEVWIAMVGESEISGRWPAGGPWRN